MKKIIVSLIVVFLLVAIAASFTNGVFASQNMASMINTINNKDDNSGAKNAATNVTGALLTVFRIAAVGVALIMLVVVAIKYMSAAPEGKAEIKKHAVIYVVGAIVLFASAGILQIIETFATNNVKP